LARGGRRLLQGHRKAHIKNDGRSASLRNEVESTLLIVNQEKGERAESNNLDMKNPSLVKYKDFT